MFGKQIHHVAAEVGGRVVTSANECDHMVLEILLINVVFQHSRQRIVHDDTTAVQILNDAALGT
jgi:hypothetical protein